MVTHKQYNGRLVDLGEPFQKVCQTVCRMLDPAQIVDKFIIAVPVRIGLMVLHGSGMHIQRLVSRCDQRFDLVVHHIVVDIFPVGRYRNGEVIFKNHLVKVELSIDTFPAVEAALERVHIGSGIAPAFIICRHCGLLPFQHHSLRHVRVIQGLHRQPEQQFKLCPYRIAGVSRHDQCPLCSHRSGFVQSGIIGIQIRIAQFRQLIGKGTEIRKRFRHDLHHVGLHAVIEVQIRHFCCQILLHGVAAVLFIILRLLQLVGEVLRTRLHKERQKTVVVELFVQDKGIVCLFGVQPEQGVNRLGNCRHGNDHDAGDQASQTGGKPFPQLQPHFQSWVEPECQQDKRGTNGNVQDQPWRNFDIGE